MIQTNEINKWYVSLFDEFEKNLNGESKSPAHSLRRKAIKDFSNLSFPTNKNEEWRFTNITPLLKHKFKLALDAPSIAKDEVDRFRFKDMKCSLMVFINGFFYFYQGTRVGLCVQPDKSKDQDDHSKQP